MPYISLLTKNQTLYWIISKKHTFNIYNKIKWGRETRWGKAEKPPGGTAQLSWATPDRREWAFTVLKCCQFCLPAPSHLLMTMFRCQQTAPTKHPLSVPRWRARSAPEQRSPRVLQTQATRVSAHLCNPSSPCWTVPRPGHLQQHREDSHLSTSSVFMKDKKMSPQCAWKKRQKEPRL